MLPSCNFLQPPAPKVVCEDHSVNPQDHVPSENDRTQYASNIDDRASSEGRGDTSNSNTSVSGNLDDLTRPEKPLTRPYGYRVVRPNSQVPDDWSKKSTLDARYAFWYEREPTKEFRLECPLSHCAKLIHGYEFRKHLRADHLGFSQDGRYDKVACIECKTEKMEVRSFADHVLEVHCDVSPL